MDIRVTFGTNLKIKRTATGLTQEQLAEAVGVDVRTITRLENGETGTEFTTIEKLAHVFNSEPYELFLPLEEPSDDKDIQALPVKAQQVYQAQLDLLSRAEGIHTRTTKKVVRDRTATSRFDQNRNQSTDKLAPIRVDALAKSYALLIREFPDEDPGAIWANLQKVHYQLVANVAVTTRMAEAVISAHQSWVKTSGTSFERFIAQTMANMVGGLSVLKPAELVAWRKEHSIVNIEKTVGFMEDDLFVVFNDRTRIYLIGVIQAKTSVRDRMKMDAIHSKQMLQAGLWSAHMTIDPDNFLGKRKFRDLADGTSEHGHVWHGVYKMSSIVSESTGVFDFDKLRDHLPQIVEVVIAGRMTSGWRPKPRQ